MISTNVHFHNEKLSLSPTNFLRIFFQLEEMENKRTIR